MLLILVFATGANATAFLQVGNSKLFYDNYESVFREDASGVYRELDYSDINNPPLLQPGDIFAGIIRVQFIESIDSGLTYWSQVPGSDELTGVFANQITFIGPDPTGSTALKVDRGSFTNQFLYDCSW